MSSEDIEPVEKCEARETEPEEKNAGQECPGESFGEKMEDLEAEDASPASNELMELINEIKSLNAQLEESRAETSSYKNEAARAKADFYNYRTRVERDREKERVLAAESTVSALIPVLVTLVRTLQAVPDTESPLYKGVSMVQRQFFSVLQTLGLRVIDTDCQFDPSQHEAIMAVEVEDENEDGKILEELHRGYKLGEKVLRAAQIKVGRKR
jgi:molecular chaperone GrpE